MSHVEAEVHDVTVLHYIFLAFDAHFAGFPNSCLSAECVEIVIFYDFGADKAFFEIGVDYSGAFRRF